jgi:hypothetical protein
MRKKKKKERQSWSGRTLELQSPTLGATQPMTGPTLWRGSSRNLRFVERGVNRL